MAQEETVACSDLSVYVTESVSGSEQKGAYLYCCLRLDVEGIPVVTNEGHGAIACDGAPAHIEVPSSRKILSEI